MRSIFSSAKYEDITPSIRQYVDKLVVSAKVVGKGKAFILDEANKKASLFVQGPAGSGKTHLAHAIVHTLTETVGGYIVELHNYTELMAVIKEDPKKETEVAIRSVAEFPGILILDDLGARNPSEFVIDTTYRILNTRYEHLLPTVITSNLDIQSIGLIFGDRIASRISRMAIPSTLG